MGYFAKKHQGLELHDPYGMKSVPGDERRRGGEAESFGKAFFERRD